MNNHSARFIDQSCIFASAFCFYLNSLFVAYGGIHTSLSAGYFTFARSLLGAIWIFGFKFSTSQGSKATNRKDLIIRAIAYYLALMSYFESVNILGPALGNTLNLTYPLFLALFMLHNPGEREKLADTSRSALLAFLGITLILQPTSESFNLQGAMFGLFSGFCAAFSIHSLRRARQVNSSEIVVKYLFGISLPLSLLFYWSELYLPSFFELNLLFWGSLFGILGQYLITFGAKHLSSIESGIISQSRILIGAIAGLIFSIGPPLNILSLVGMFLIFLVNLHLVQKEG